MFGSAVAAFQAGLEGQGALRAEFTFEDVPAPKRLAPFAAATAATVRRDDADIAWGRLVLLYDPAAPEGWHGCFRLISYLRAEIDPEIAADPMLGQVGWTWLIEALDARTPGYGAPSGTVTRVTTEGFGGKEEEPPVHGYEQRASWSPTAGGKNRSRRARARTAAIRPGWTSPRTSPRGATHWRPRRGCRRWPSARTRCPRRAGRREPRASGGAGDRRRAARRGRGTHGAGRAPARAA